MITVTPCSYVSKGMYRAVQAPGSLRAVVGPGFLVVLSTASQDIGGMVHFSGNDFSQSHARKHLTTWLKRLLKEMKKLGADINELTADVIGGADILRVRSDRWQERWKEQHERVFRQTLEAEQIKIQHFVLGGIDAQRAELILPGSRCKIVPVHHLKHKATRIIEQEDTQLETMIPDIKTEPELIVNMGCMKVSQSPDRLVALLGSCVGIALYDPVLKLGGLAHVMLPRQKDHSRQQAKYVDTAVPALMDALQKQGAEHSRLLAKLAGGANVLDVKPDVELCQIGKSNIEVARDTLQSHGINLQWEDIGGRQARKFIVNLKDFSVNIKKLEIISHF